MRLCHARYLEITVSSLTLLALISKRPLTFFEEEASKSLAITGSECGCELVLNKLIHDSWGICACGKVSTFTVEGGEGSVVLEIIHKVGGDGILFLGRLNFDLLLVVDDFGFEVGHIDLLAIDFGFDSTWSHDV